MTFKKQYRETITEIYRSFLRKSRKGLYEGITKPNEVVPEQGIKLLTFKTDDIPTILRKSENKGIQIYVFKNNDSEKEKKAKSRIEEILKNIEKENGKKTRKN